MKKKKAGEKVAKRAFRSGTGAKKRVSSGIIENDEHKEYTKQPNWERKQHRRKRWRRSRTQRSHEPKWCKDDSPNE